MEERKRAAVRENLRENQQHETLLNLSKEINQILDAKRAVRENLTATSSARKFNCHFKRGRKTEAGKPACRSSDTRKCCFSSTRGISKTRYGNFFMSLATVIDISID
jgi:hypothetical protein